jgi:menaquinone-9 beta-reductase
MKAELDRDVVIIGAGPGGATAALFLAKAGVPCTLVDKAVFPRDKVCGDALSGKVVEVLHKLDPSLVAELGGAASHLGSWGVVFVAPNEKALRVPFKRQYDKHKEQAPGFIARRTDFDDVLVRRCKANPLVEVVEGLGLTAFHRQDGRWELRDDQGQLHYRARIVLVADGANSRFAREVHHVQMEPKHHCAGIRAYYKGVKGMDGDNFIELHFLKDFLPGYFWIFPLPGGYANVGVGMRTDKVSARKLNLKTELQRILEAYPQLKERFEGATLEGPVRGYGLPLGSRRRKISGDGYLLIGDAASLIDPFTGEGIGNALYSGFFAAEQAIAALAAGDTSAEALARYDQAVYDRLWNELKLSHRMQQLVRFPWLFNLVVNKARRNRTLSETISCMFEDIDLRDRLRSPGFYFKLLFDNGR